MPNRTRDRDEHDYDDGELEGGESGRVGVRAGRRASADVGEQATLRVPVGLLLVVVGLIVLVVVLQPNSGGVSIFTRFLNWMSGGSSVQYLVHPQQQAVSSQLQSVYEGGMVAPQDTVPVMAMHLPEQSFYATQVSPM